MTALAGAYFVTAKLGLQLAFVHASATAVWPPTGITIAALLMLGYHPWPGIFLGAFLANLTTAGTASWSVREATAGQMRRLRAAGAKACLTKPIDVRKLLELFDELLAERGSDAREAAVDG